MDYRKSVPHNSSLHLPIHTDSYHHRPGTLCFMGTNVDVGTHDLVFREWEGNIGSVRLVWQPVQVPLSSPHPYSHPTPSGYQVGYFYCPSASPLYLC